MKRAIRYWRGRPILSISLITLILCSGIWTARAIFPPKPKATSLSAHFSRTGDLSVVFRDQPADTTSPACGCYRDRPPGGWRGIVFPASSFTIKRTSKNIAGSIRVEYYIFPPATQTFQGISTALGLKAHVALELIPDSVPLTSEVLLHPFKYHLRLEHGFAVTMAVDQIGIITSHPLHVISQGLVPAAALIPAFRARTNVSYSANPDTLQLFSSFAPSPAPPFPYTHEDDTPAVDVLGQTRAVWTDVSNIAFPLSVATTQAPKISGPINFDMGTPTPKIGAPPPGYRRIALVSVVPGTSFATRITVWKPSVLQMGEFPNGTLGGIMITVPINSSKRLARLFRRANRSPKVLLTHLLGFNTAIAVRSLKTPDSRAYRREEERFEYPPNPTSTGVNVFGAISSLQLEQAQGAVTIGLKPLTYDAPTPINLENIVGEGIVGNRFYVPIRLTRTSASIEIQGQANTTINGVPVATSPSLVDRALGDDKLMLVATVLATLAALVSVSQAVGQHKSKANEGRRS